MTSPSKEQIEQARKLVPTWAVLRPAELAPLRADVAAALAAAVRQEKERCATICDEHALRMGLAKGAAEAAGRDSVASHRQSDIETCDRIAAAIRGEAARGDAR